MYLLRGITRHNLPLQPAGFGDGRATEMVAHVWLDLRTDFLQGGQQFVIIRRLVERIRLGECNLPFLVHDKHSPFTDSRKGLFLT